MIKRILPILLLGMLSGFALQAQVTTSNISCSVQSTDGVGLDGATVTVKNTATGDVYTSTTRNGGRFELANVPPGGPYTIEITFTGHKKIVRDNIFLTLGETSQQNFTMSTNAEELKEVVVTTTKKIKQSSGGQETTIGRDKMDNLPTVGRNMSDYLRYVPQAKITGDGGVSISGQNNRYNSFYIDGAVNNDVFGLAASGTNGGQSGIAPISIDAIDQFQVVISPYNAALGNFTGGGINAITRSGSNVFKGSVYYFFRNQNTTGKTPGVAKADATKLDKFSDKTTGFRLGGPIIKNKLFFFLNGEIQRDIRPQPYTGGYRGNSSEADIANLTNYLKNTYGYDPGGYLDNPEKVQANRVAVKIDWKINPKNKLTASYRYNEGFRNNTSRSSSSTINFYNNGYTFPTETQSGSLELNSRFKNNANNRLLLTFTEVEDNRGEIGNPFPRVTINDGSGRLVFGTEEFSTANLLNQKNYAIYDEFKFYKNKHTITVGTDNEISTSENIFIRQNYGSYTFDDLNTFMTGGLASTYRRSYSLLDPGKTGDQSVNAAADFKTGRFSLFANDEVKVNNQLTITFGVRTDITKFLTKPKTDDFFNDTALAIISQYYNMHGARSGESSEPRWSLNPRLGFEYKMPKEKLTLRGGLGLFTGRVPLVWPGGVYNNNGISIAGISQSNVAFRPDPFNQYTAADFGINVPIPSGQIDLIADDFRMNKVFRTSLALDKDLGNGWKATLEGVYTHNINEIYYQNVNILPPTKTAIGPDNRNVYDLSGSFVKSIPLRPDGSNPYTGIFLLSNNEGKKGFSYSITASIDKAFADGWALNANYTYGNSVVVNEGTSSQNSSQWRYMETVNGRNFLGRSTSDFDLGHRISIYVAKQFKYWQGKMATTVALVYNGQSGSPFSYIMNRGMVRDYDNFETNDLIYVPTEAELATMVFQQNGSLSPNDQRTAYNEYIMNDKYLSTRRGQYAERNGSRTPFTNVIDLKLKQDFNLKLGAKTYQLQLTYNVFNFTNMLSRNWGKQYFASNDQINIIDFRGYVSSSNLTPQYRFTPAKNFKELINLSDGVFNSSRWSSQLGIRLSF